MTDNPALAQLLAGYAIVTAHCTRCGQSCRLSRRMVPHTKCGRCYRRDKSLVPPDVRPPKAKKKGKPDV